MQTSRKRQRLSCNWEANVHVQRKDTSDLGPAEFMPTSFQYSFEVAQLACEIGAHAISSRDCCQQYSLLPKSKIRPSCSTPYWSTPP